MVNLSAALISALVAWSPIPSLDRLLTNQPGAGVPLVMVTALTVYLLYLILTALPQTLTAMRAS
jgi:TM2 domain-containing membrane protein YozV